ncbi:hypothetical protein ACP4OV_000483 [Aristida adscensionis]
MSDGKPPDPSLCPPSHGYPPNKSSPTSWVLLDLYAYIADRENATSARGKTSDGKAIQVTLCTAPPPLVSYICVWCPDAEIAVAPTVEAAEADLFLLRGAIGRYRHYFVYKARGTQGPSLRLLEDPRRYFPLRYNFTLVPHSEVAPRGYLCRRTVDDDNFYVAALNQPRALEPRNREISVFNSKDGKWSTTPFTVDGVRSHITAKVISLGEGLLGFVDLWRGVIVCDVLGCKPPCFLQLPQELARFDLARNEPWLARDIALVQGRLTVVNLGWILEQASITGSKVSSWSRKVTDDWEEEWRMDYRLQSSDVLIDSNSDNRCSRLRDDEGRYQPSFANLYTAHPTLSLSDSRIVYIMGKVNSDDKKALVLSVDMRTPRLQGVAVFDAERMPGVNFSYTFTQSKIPKYFNMAPGISHTIGFIIFSLPVLYVVSKRIGLLTTTAKEFGQRHEIWFNIS